MAKKKRSPFFRHFCGKSNCEESITLNSFFQPFLRIAKNRKCGKERMSGQAFQIPDTRQTGGFDFSDAGQQAAAGIINNSAAGLQTSDQAVCWYYLSPAPAGFQTSDQAVCRYYLSPAPAGFQTSDQAVCRLASVTILPDAVRNQKSELHLTYFSP